MKTLWWIDVETTGLSSVTDKLLEIAISTAPFDDPFNATPVYHRVLSFSPNAFVEKFVVEMHTKSGLLMECYESPTPLVVVHAELWKLIPDDLTTNNILAGSSVHFDRGFLPEDIAKRFSHRHYDVSAVKMFCESIGMPPLPKAEAHRAQADVLESISHAKQCAEWRSPRA